MLPAIVGGLVFAGAEYALDTFFNKTPTTSNLPVHVPTSTSPATIPTKKPVVRVSSRVDDLVGLVSGVRGNSVINTTNNLTNYSNNVSNVTNNYNNQQTITNNIKSMPTTTLIDTLAANGAGALAMKSSIDELVAVTANGSAVSAAVGGAIYNKLDDLVAAVYVVASAIYENGSKTAVSTTDDVNINTNIFDTVPLVEAISALGDLINPPERTDFYTTSTAVNEYKITPASVTDIFGNDLVTASPLELQTMKNIGVATSTALENSTTAEDAGLDDILSDYDSLGVDFLKIFQFNGITENLQAIAGIAENDFETHTPNVNLKEVPL